MKDIHARVAIDKKSALVAFGKGVNYEPNKKVQTNDSDLPLAIKPITKVMLIDPNFINLTNVKFGRFTVIGLSLDFSGWVVKCVCGKFTTRSKKAILNPKNTQDRCEHCRHIAHLKRTHEWEQTGRDADINDY